MDPENGANDVVIEESLRVNNVLRGQLAVDTISDPRRNFRDFERNLLQSATSSDETAVQELLEFAETCLSRPDVDRTHIMRILWRAAIPAPVAIADLIIASKSFDLGFLDDINGRTSLHEVALAGEVRLVDLCLTHGIAVNREDVYGRSALHYAVINGHGCVARRLLSANADANLLDMDNHTPLIYAVVNGHRECVRILVDHGHVTVGAPAQTSNLLPLSLACQYGHLDNAIFLLEKGAISAPNSNGEFPIHLAAREGHADVCRLLVSQEGGGNKDTPDKYSEWTPLFHAARRGFEECVQVLLGASANPQATDEHGKTAVFYAAWHGHIKCSNRLLEAMASSAPSRTPKAYPATRVINASFSSKSPDSDSNASPYDHSSLGGGADADMDFDMIPSLSLPPPIMPFRIYGHNYLDKMYLLQVSLGGTTDPPVTLLPSVTRHSEFTGRLGARQHITPSVKIVMTLRPNEADLDIALISSHSTTLPLADNGEVFSFQMRSLDDITLEFSFYPIFGSKAIGRAVASPQTLRDACSSSPRAVPILDHRLHVIGKVR
jgi:CDK inhibitor PHO81